MPVIVAVIGSCVAIFAASVMIYLLFFKPRVGDERERRRRRNWGWALEIAMFIAFTAVPLYIREQGRSMKLPSPEDLKKLEPLNIDLGSVVGYNPSSDTRLKLGEKLRSPDTTIRHDALLFARDSADAPEVVPDVITTLGEMLQDPKREEGGTRRLACEVLGKYRNPAAIPVLIAALDDPFVDDIMTPIKDDGPVHMGWFAVWRDADRALRQITGASPIEKPGQREPRAGQAERVKKAWADWWSEHQSTPRAGSAGP